MKISTRGRYVLRLMLDLACDGKEGVVSIKTIASRQDISTKYLEQIISMLGKAGYVKSIRGAQGGYKLTHEPQYYTVGMILRLTEGSLSPVSCLDDKPNLCPRAEKCVTLNVWKKLDEAINNVVDNITLADLMQISEDSTSTDEILEKI
ncbi:MAG: Rrf2 family transcriptional regulator [Firmicutes bacterium]|nr:Rrf2 family transcriptional regulator [Bacillota bacterium]